MDDNFTKDFVETFQCIVQGENIVEARYNAYTALEHCVGTIPLYHWKLAMMEHKMVIQEDDEGKKFAVVMLSATWICDPNADDGIPAEEIAPDRSLVR